MRIPPWTAVIFTALLCAACAGGEASRAGSVWVRVTLIEPAVEWRVGIASHWAQGKQGGVFAGQAAGAKIADVAWVPAAGSSVWVDLSAWIPDGVASVIFHIETKTKFDGGIKARIDVASAADDAAIVRSITEADPGRIIALRIPAKLKEDAARLVSVREDAVRRLNEIKAFNLPEGPFPKKIWCMTGFRSNGQFYTDPAIAELDFESIRLLGMNGFWEQNGGQPGALRGMAEAHGLDRSTVYWRDVESPPRMKSGKVALDWDALSAYIDGTYRRAIAGTRKAHPAGMPTLIADLMDEPAGQPFGGPEYHAGFRDFVQRQGFEPRFFGKDDWEHIEPFEFNWRQFFKQRAETELTSVETRRLFYWSLRFWNHCTARLYALATRKVQELAPGTQTRVNAGPPWMYDYGTLPRGIDIFEMGRLRGVTLGFNEDWCGSGNARLPLELNTLLVDWSRAAMRPSDALPGSYITRDADRSSVKLRTFACLARECKIFDFYYYGPAYTFFDHWSDNAPMVQGVAELTRDIGQADDILSEGRAPRANVALLYSHSWPVWKEDDTEQCEQMMVYLALLHAGIPVDIVEDAEITDGRFAARRYQCLYVVNESIATATAAEIERWVRGGGKLWMSGWAGMKDEYNTPVDSWNAMLGLKSRAWKPAGDLKRLGQIIEPADYRRPIFQRNVELMPARMTRTFGAGEIEIVPRTAGVDYMNSAKEQKGSLGKAVVFPAGPARDAIVGMAQRAKVAVPATTNVNQILAWPLWTSHNGVILIANFTGEPAKEVVVSFTAPVVFKTLRSLRAGDVTNSMRRIDASRVEVTLPVSGVTDMLIAE